MDEVVSAIVEWLGNPQAFLLGARRRMVGFGL
ncbi:hypothetical protein BAY1663_02655 [Pseudomonas sp. BAY1663]|nr:hypothetical protein BAY1663_02655 [Pseudomonas sp. BAY1663]